MSLQRCRFCVDYSANRRTRAPHSARRQVSALFTETVKLLVPRQEVSELSEHQDQRPARKPPATRKLLLIAHSIYDSGESFRVPKGNRLGVSQELRIRSAC